MECLPWRTCTTLTFFCAALPRSSQPQCPDIDPANIHGPKVENPSSNACLSNSSFPPLHILRSRSFPFFHLKRKGIPKAVGGGRHSQRICCLQSPEHPPPPSPVILWFLVNSQFCEEGHCRQLRQEPPTLRAQNVKAKDISASSACQQYRVFMPSHFNPQDNSVR